jgi:hypothetical protein
MKFEGFGSNAIGEGGLDALDGAWHGNDDAIGSDK